MSGAYDEKTSLMDTEVPIPENVAGIVFAYYGVLAPPAPRLGDAATRAVAELPSEPATTAPSAAGLGLSRLLPVLGYALDQQADAALDEDFQLVPAATVVYETLLAMQGEPPSEQTVVSLVETFGRLEALPMNDDAVVMLRTLRESGLAMGLLCGCTMPGRFLRERWDAEGGGGLFDHVVLASDWGWCPPHPSVFQAVLDGLDCKPEEALVVCGNFRTHIQGADALGLRTVWLRPAASERIAQVGDSYVVRDLGVLLDWFAGSF